jgi:hypothetical protein
LKGVVRVKETLAFLSTLPVATPQPLREFDHTHRWSGPASRCSWCAEMLAEHRASR